MKTLAALALFIVILHILTNGQYGFHRDELATLDDARHLAWGFVAYPPVTPLFGRIALELFGPSLVGVRFFPALAQAFAVLLSGLMARELGGNKPAQIVAAVAVAVAPVSLGAGALFQYVSFDYLWWVLIAWLVMRLLKSGDPRWWLAVGAVIGIGMMTKYTMGFLAAGIAVGVLFTATRRDLRSRWLWFGAALSLLIFLPNLIWQIQHNFISLDFLSSIHARDVRIGRTSGFLKDQLLMNLFTFPLSLAGLYFYFAVAEGKRYRLIGWMFVIPFVLFFVAQGRGYYMAAGYPMLIAAGAVLWERWISFLTSIQARVVRATTWTALAAGGVFAAAIVLPIAPLNSPWWNFASKVNNDFREEIGWPELVETVADIFHSLPAEQRAQAGILAGNYGEAGAINLYGPEYGLPTAISGVNSYWFRGYGDPAPRTLIVLGFSRAFLERNFDSCELAGRIKNRHAIRNEETDRPDVFVCRGLRKPWSEFWKQIKAYG